MKQIRKIIQIDEERCNGCGLCVLDCAEGAIQIVDGKAKVLTDSFCDGLGACLGSCPMDALKIIEREAAPFDEQAAMAHVARVRSEEPACAPDRSFAENSPASLAPHGGCPGLASRNALWPVKLRLVPPEAPFLRDADLVIAADCAAPVCATFRQRYANGAVVLIACPKFEERQAITDKLQRIFSQAQPRSCTVIRMEVPCCAGIISACREAHAAAGGGFVLRELTLSRGGQEMPPLRNL